MLEQGEVEQKIIQQCMRTGKALPKRIAEAPILQQGLEIFYIAFFDLSSSRPIGFSEGQISWISMWDYCERLEIRGSQRDDLIYLVSAMDRAYLKHRKKEAET